MAAVLEHNLLIWVERSKFIFPFNYLEVVAIVSWNIWFARLLEWLLSVWDCGCSGKVIRFLSAHLEVLSFHDVTDIFVNEARIIHLIITMLQSLSNLVRTLKHAWFRPIDASRALSYRVPMRFFHRGRQNWVARLLKLVHVFLVIDHYRSLCPCSLITESCSHSIRNFEGLIVIKQIFISPLCSFNGQMFLIHKASWSLIRGITIS